LRGSFAGSRFRRKKPQRAVRTIIDRHAATPPTRTIGTLDLVDHDGRLRSEGAWRARQSVAVPVGAPETLFPRALLHTSTVAHVVISKVGIGVPHHRLEQDLADPVHEPRYLQILRRDIIRR
jgi:hypothetical protein